MILRSKSKKSIKYIQSCITSVSFPETIDDVLNMVKGNEHIAKWSTDLDVLLNVSSGNTIFWTAPKWLTEGDVMFFYHTKRAKVRTAKVLAEAQQEFPHKRNLIKLTSVRDKN